MSDRSVSIAVTSDPTVSLCLQQNDVPLIKRIELRNVGATSLHELTVRVRAEPAFAHEFSVGLASLAPGSSRVVEAVDLLLSPEFLVAQTESARGLLHVTVEAAGQVVGSTSHAVDVLAYDQWSGSRSLPELLAAFVIPNHPVVEQVLARAAALLRDTGLPDALDGYQRESRNAVKQMVSAIYEALRREGIGYILPPASFERAGQKVRTPDRILHSRLGTCLDLALMVAACCEQAGLHTLLVLVEGHAFTAVWLDDKMLSTTSSDDGIDLRKRIDAGEMVALETTLLTGAQAQPFEKAASQARRQLDDLSRFHCVVDVARARQSRVRPLHGRVNEQGTFQPLALATTPTRERGPMPALSTLREPSREAITDKRAETRLDVWRRKLLDLTMHNRLLSFRPGAKTLPLLCPELGQFEDMLADGTSFQLLSRPSEFGEMGQRDAAAYARATGDDARNSVLRAALSSKRLHIDLDQTQLERRALEIYREARLAQEESGTSALFCALGFMTWYQSDDSDRPRRAPLLLLPVNLVRASVEHGFKLEAGDDEPRINVSLLEMLKQDFSLDIAGLDPLPMDEHGVDVPRVFELLRAAISGIKRWEVNEEVHIGFFSFSKFLMWRDLQEHAGDLLQNAVVRHLVESREQDFDPGGPIPKPEEIDHTRPPQTTFCPLSADSSQMAAVFAAAEGRSFVLEGPPGTGKSQTITNMIAQCLATGKTVLFVAEKNVALNVVHERLEASELGDFCLELHSNKAKKADVMRQLERAMSRTPTREPPEWSRASTRVADLRGRLNDYVEALHRPRPNGESVYQGLTQLIGLSDVPLVRMEFGPLAALDEARLATARELTRRMETVGQSVGVPKQNPWRFVERAGWDPVWQGRVEQLLSSLQRAVEEVVARTPEASRALGLRDESLLPARLRAMAEACRVLVNTQYVPSGLLLEAEWSELRRRVELLVETGRRRDALRTSVQATFSPQVVALDLDAVLGRLKRAAAAWAPLRWIQRFLTRRLLRPVLLPSAQVGLESLDSSVERALALKNEQNTLAAESLVLASKLGALLQRGEGRWDDIARALVWTSSARSASLLLAHDDAQQARALREGWATLVAETPEALATKAPKGAALTRFQAAMDELERGLEAWERELGLPVGAVLAAAPGGGDLASLAGWLRELSMSATRLRAWCQWREVRTRALEIGLKPLVDAFESGSLSAAALRRSYEKAFYTWFTEHAIAEDPVLRGFHSSEHAQAIAEFSTLDDAQRALCGHAVRGRVGARSPAMDVPSSKSSALGILRKETQKKKRHMAVRALLGETGDVVMRLTPCFLMSPISVAQYLDARMPKFDVVIFDEASQIPAWEAAGAIARGRSAIVVGDPKQLPPTSFFGRGEQEEGEGAAELDDLESILDDCIGAGLPWLRLRWHYRSRHESLITFSNHHYYDNKLVTLPSADTHAATDRGVSFRYIADGVYDKGKSRTNRREAEAVVQEVVRRLLSPNANGSIGIVTFNTEQRTLIEDLLDVARRTHPSINPHFADGKDDSVFVKNLESVQGDERDVILFSIGYGPDAEGRVSMNFGPMNREGGHRRLNVAITRARCEVLVFSSLRAEQIDITRTQARGVRDLKAFLDFAERGVRAIREASVVDSQRDFDSPFEEDVCQRLRKLGWEVIPQVGCSSYRIDLGIVDPEARGRFLAGVECDGASYHSAASARDRDKLRASVLAGLGWKLHRVWSTDFWHDADGEMRKLHEALERELMLARERRANSEQDDGPLQSPDPIPNEQAANDNAEELAAAPGHVLADRDQERSAPYQRADVGRQGSASSFYEPLSLERIASSVRLVIAQEGPISLSLLTRRVGEAWAFGRVTTQVQDRVQAAIPESVVREAEDELLFLWPEGVEPMTYEGFRVHDDPIVQREALDISLTEIRNAALHVLRTSGSSPSDDLARRVANLLGFQRMGSRVAARMNSGVKRLLEVGWATERGGKIVANR